MNVYNQEELVTKTYYYLSTTNIFTVDVSVSIRDLHQKKYD